MTTSPIASRCALARGGELTSLGRSVLVPLAMVAFLGFVNLGAVAFGASITLRGDPEAVGAPEFLVLAVAIAVVLPSFAALCSVNVLAAALGLVTFGAAVSCGVPATLWAGTTLTTFLAERSATPAFAYPLAVGVTYLAIVAATVANLLFAQLASTAPARRGAPLAEVGASASA